MHNATLLGFFQLGYNALLSNPLCHALIDQSECCNKDQHRNRAKPAVPLTYELAVASAK